MMLVEEDLVEVASAAVVSEHAAAVAVAGLALARVDAEARRDALDSSGIAATPAKTRFVDLFSTPRTTRLPTPRPSL